MTVQTTKTVSLAKPGKSKDGADAGDETKPAGDGKPAPHTAKSDVPAANDGSRDPLPTTIAVAADANIAVTAAPQEQTVLPQGAPAKESGPNAAVPELVALQIGNGKEDVPPKPQDAKSVDAAPRQYVEPPVTADDGATPPSAADGDAKAPILATDGTKAQNPVNDANKPDANKTTPANAKTDAPPPQHHAASTNTLTVPPPDGNAAAAASKAANSNQQVTLPVPASPPATTPTANQAALAQPAAVPLAGVAIEIAGKAFAGKNRFEIRLDPPELGRIDVRLDVDRNGHVTSHLTVDRPDTLNLLRQDSAGLERALQDAGLKTSDNGLQFSLRDQNTGQDQPQAPNPRALQIVVDDDALANTTAIPQRSRIAGMGSGLDIRV